MRPFELILTLLNVVAFLVLAFSRNMKISLFSYIILVLVFTAVFHFIYEGYRWQMIPGYILVGLLAFTYFFKIVFTAGRPIVANHFNWLIFTVGVLGIIISAVLPVILPVFKLPGPGGSYKIGTLTYCWKDTDRPDIFTSDPSDKRKLMVQIWYPSDGSKSFPKAAYVENSNTLVPLAKLLKLPGFMLGHLKYITTNAVKLEPASNVEAKYPVLIFSHGRGGYRQQNTLLVEELVSHGFIVAAIDHTYTACGVEFPDGSVVPFDNRMLDRRFVDSMIPYLAQDVVFTLNKLTELNQNDQKGILSGKLNLQQVGIFGLSLGGEVSAEACLLDGRFKACLIMDVWMPKDVLREGLKKPAMWISRDPESMRLEGWSEADIHETQNTMQTVYNNLPGSGYMVRVKGMYHQDFSDAPLLSPLTSMLGITGSIDGRRAHAITSAYALAFFDKYLKGGQEVLLEGPSKQYPEVLFEKH